MSDQALADAALRAAQSWPRLLREAVERIADLQRQLAEAEARAERAEQAAAEAQAVLDAKYAQEEELRQRICTLEGREKSLVEARFWAERDRKEKADPFEDAFFCLWFSSRWVEDEEEEEALGQCINWLELQFAEAQAREAELRGALEGLASTDYDGGPLCWCSEDWGAHRHEAGCRRASAALALPHDGSALAVAVERARSEERAACIAACENEQVVGVGDPGSPQGHYNRACADCARAIEERGRDEN